MRFLRNPEVKSELLVSLVLILAFAVPCLFIKTVLGLVVLGLGILLFAVHFSFLYWRYERVSALSDMLDRVLHGDETFAIESYSEGELSILAREAEKMTVRLREQAAALKEEKQLLTDSIADISHQLKTPLTSMNIIISLLKKSDLSAERRAELVRELERLSAHIDSLVNTLLKLSRFDAGTVTMKRDRVPLETVIQRAAADLAIPMELKGQTLNVRVRPDAMFYGDLAWTAEAIGNILKNCMEHTPQDGRIDVNGEENALYTRVIIRDSGKGISPADMPHLFSRFYRGKDAAAQSVGIGLALARTIIALQNGTIRAENANGGGAQFTICFYKGVV